MKNLFFKVFIVFSLVICAQMTHAQTYLSKPQAVKNLSDAAKHLNAILPNLEENDLVEYKVSTEKLRFIQKLLKAIKLGNTVQEASEKYLPKDDITVIQPSIRRIDTTSKGVAPNVYIRSEILFLIAY